MKREYHLGQTDKPFSAAKIIIAELDDDGNLVLSGMAGIPVKAFPIRRLFEGDYVDLDNENEHNCDDGCQRDHCDNGDCNHDDCVTINIDSLRAKIDEIKHAFHQMEDILNV